MTNIQTTAIRLIANAFLYSREKGKECHGYRFDSSFLTKRDITSVADMEELQKELNKRGWSFTVLNFNDFVIQDKTFLAEMTKLGFGRVEQKSDEEVKKEHLADVNERIRDRFYDMLLLESKVDNLDIKLSKSDVNKDTNIASSSIEINDNISLGIITKEDCSILSIDSVQYGVRIGNYITKSVREKFKELYSITKDILELHKTETAICEKIKTDVYDKGMIFDIEYNYCVEKGVTIYVSILDAETSKDIGEIFRVRKGNGGVQVTSKVIDNVCNLSELMQDKEDFVTKLNTAIHEVCKEGN